MVYAVEQGSAGEEAAKSKGWSTNPVQSQAKALMEVNSGTSDAAIIDLLMAGAMIGEGTSYPDLKYTDKLTTEEYGVGCRKGSDLAAYINNFFSEIYASGEMKTIADTYKVSDTLVEQAKAGEYVEGDDVKYIKDKGTLVVGITEFEPMDYKDEDGNWIKGKQRFKSVEREAVELINMITGANIAGNEKEEVVDVCRAWENSLKKAKDEGQREGRLEGVREGEIHGRREGKIEGKIEAYVDCDMTIPEIAKKVSKSEEYVKDVIKKISAACL